MNEALTVQSTKAEPETWGAFINGEFRPAVSGKTFPTFNPGNGEILAHLPECDEEDVDNAVRAAVAAFQVDRNHVELGQKPAKHGNIHQRFFRQKINWPVAGVAGQRRIEKTLMIHGQDHWPVLNDPFAMNDAEAVEQLSE